MNEKDWTHKLKDRLNDYSTPAPEGLWDDISAALDAQSREKKTAIIVPWQRWLTTAAAIALLVAGGAYLLWPSQEAQLPIAKRNTTQQDNAHTAEQECIPSIVDGSEQGIVAMISRQADIPSAQAILTENGQSLSLSNPESSSLQPESETTESPNESIEKHHVTQGNTPTNTTPRTKHDIGRSNESISTVHRNLSSITIGFHASNAWGEHQSISALSSSAMLSSAYADASTEEMKPVPVIANYTEKKHHNRPISYGLSVSYGLNKRLSLSTGVVYTQAVSDFTHLIGQEGVTDRQTLTYVGVPLAVSYRVLSGKHFSAYVKAGGQADFNVSAKMKTENVETEKDKDRPQFSVDAALGAEYRFLPHLGIYVEPGIKYYVDNKSSVENIFKERPCTFNLQLGLRFTINE